MSELDAPLTIGVKIIPKTSSMNKGFDLVLYCELWLCNLTSLPIIFGASSHQLMSKGTDRKSKKLVRDRSSTLNAETALMELSSILEFGEKGHSFISDYEKSNENGEILSLPKQQADVITGKKVFTISFVLVKNQTSHYHPYLQKSFLNMSRWRKMRLRKNGGQVEGITVQDLLQNYLKLLL